MDNKTSFKDSKGREWSLRITIGAAMALRDQLRLDVGKILDSKGTLFQELAADPIRLVEAVELLTADQIASQKVERKDFLDSLDGETLDRALEAFLYAIAASLGKLQRRALEAAVPRMIQGLDELATGTAKRIEAVELPTFGP